MSRVTSLAAALALAAAASIALAQEPKAPARQMHPRMEQMRENQKKLDDLVAKMNAAKGEAKVDAIAAVLNELVAQRKEMRKQMAAGPGPMRGPMMRRPPEPKPAE